MDMPYKHLLIKVLEIKNHSLSQKAQPLGYSHFYMMKTINF